MLGCANAAGGGKEFDLSTSFILWVVSAGVIALGLRLRPYIALGWLTILAILLAAVLLLYVLFFVYCIAMGAAGFVVKALTGSVEVAAMVGSVAGVVAVGLLIVVVARRVWPDVRSKYADDEIPHAMAEHLLVGVVLLIVACLVIGVVISIVEVVMGIFTSAPEFAYAAVVLVLVAVLMRKWRKEE